MVATRGRTFKRPWRRSCHSSKLKSSSAPIGQKDSWCFHAVGSSNAPLLGSTAAEGSQRIGRTSIATRWRSCGLPQSASCSENFVIPPDVFGQTLSAGHDGHTKFLFLNLVASFLKSKRWGNRAAEDRSLSNLLYLSSIWVIPIIVAITFHEVAHGFVAHLFGDETAWRLGRVSLNPLKHIDPVGTILLPGFLLLLP